MKPISRRRFITTTGAAAAAPFIVPARVLGQQAPSKHITLAAIGCGGRGGGNVYHEFVKAQPDVRVVAACDCFADKREGFANLLNEHYGQKVCAPVADFREVLARDDIDGVVISTADHWHVPLAAYAAVAGKDMYVEKPLTVAMEWAWKLRKIAAERGVVFQFGTQQRSGGEFTRTVELVRNGYIGKVTSIDAWCPDMSTQFSSASVPPYGAPGPAEPPAGLDYDRWVGPAPMKAYSPDRCTPFGGYHIYDYALGFIAGWGIHPLDIAQWGLDMDHSGPVRYEGTGTVPPNGSLWDSLESWDVHAEYANGVDLHFMGSRVAKPVLDRMDPQKRPWTDHGTTFFGTDGWISVSRNAVYASSKDLQNAQISESEKPVYRSGSQARNFVDCIRSRKAPISPLESAIRGDTICHLSDICIREGRPIRWDPAQERILDDEAATAYLDRPLRGPWTI